MKVIVAGKAPQKVMLELVAENPAESMILANVAIGPGSRVTVDMASSKPYADDKPMNVYVNVGAFQLDVHMMSGGEGAKEEP